MEENWRFMKEILNGRPQRIEHPALMITAGRDRVLTPSMVDRYTVPYVPHLTRGHVEEAGLQVSSDDVVVVWLGDQ